MEAHEEDWNPEQNVSFDQFGSIITTVGFLSESVRPDHADYKLLQQLWEVMDGTAREGVNVVDLAYTLKIIRGFRDPALEVEDQASGFK